MTIYLANPSTQRHQFHYREPVKNLLLVVELDAGTQTAIGSNWTAGQQHLVIEQLERHGARDAAESHGRMGKFAGLLYRDTGVIESDEIEAGHEAELQTRSERSVAETTKAALGFDRSARAPSRERPSAATTETAVRQDIAPGDRPKGDEVNFSLAVTPEGRSDVTLPT